MGTTKKKTKTAAKSVKKTGEQPVKKSKIARFWEKYPEGIFEIVDMDAVLK